MRDAARRRRRQLRKRACAKRVSAAPLAASPSASRSRRRPPPRRPRPFRLTSPVAVYSGAFGVRQAERLLWRAASAPRRVTRRRSRRWASPRGRGAHPAGRRRDAHRRRATDGDGNPLAPADAWGHDHLWLLDRMVRTNQPLVERMTLVWHDWFATSNDGVGSRA